MENTEILLAITELKSSIDKRFDALEKNFEKRLDSVSGELYKIKQNLDTVDGQQYEDTRKQMDKIEKDIEILNQDVMFLAKKLGVHDLKLIGIENKIYAKC
ncbi:hypothetical protein DJ86_657 [Bacillus cereus ATCC 4342]|uniref:hypothetical protein n=1 Tax=Bacillus tropicus TaxID=2026188 RepID=UPI0001A01617|nr:hypothetical protein [Bacillus tropicus]AJH75435.1 hypothetical protein BF35_3911 [Bacillus cereus ATCC 4342]EEK82557.1 hypothetical protein bcere0010_40290 [Bacillus cereus ATCC 4342]KFM85627.1 hypothetical protein DJ86_657 [Bacillus cereus ATCC 4342]MDR4455207.1 hypothetical protein [Bacillus tropicus]QKH55991.1 hypothetical protein FOC76_10940 [Bacillus tropicus]